MAEVEKQWASSPDGLTQSASGRAPTAIVADSTVLRTVRPSGQAQALGMATGVLDAVGLGDGKAKASAAQAKAVEEGGGCAQVFPEHTFHIVDVLPQ